MSGLPNLRTDNSIDPAWLATLDLAVKNALSAGLLVILDEHDNIFCYRNGAFCAKQLPLFWQALAEHYRSAPDTVGFELLNEPNGEMNPIWNKVVEQTLSAIRLTNPKRIVIVGPTGSYNLDNLMTLRLPPQDRAILVTFHYYRPMEFTHQGAPWEARLASVKDVGWGSEFQRQSLAADFAKVRIWARESRRPILLGEFGAYDRSGTALSSLLEYDAAVVSEAELNGFGWCYWQFSGLNDFSSNWARDVVPLLPALTRRK